MKIFSPARVSVLVIAALAVLSMYRFGLLDPQEIWAGLSRLGAFSADLFPPQTSAENLQLLLRALLETVEIAFVGTLLGFVFSIPLAVLATSTLFGLWLTASVRLVLGAIRTIPSLLWAVVFVVGFGLGPAAGALAVAFYTIGYLSKLFYEAFEAVDVEVLDAVKAVSRNRLQMFLYAIFPESTNAIISQLLFMFEYNIRASTIMGFVGAGGIGFYIRGYLELLQYQYLVTTLLLVFAVVMVIDYLSTRLRSRILPNQQQARVPLWGGVTTLFS